MPLSKKDRKISSRMASQYGKDKGKRVFYATLNKRISEGRPIDVPESKRLMAKRRHSKRTKRRGLRRRRL